jgi:hypothetical protein
MPEEAGELVGFVVFVPFVAVVTFVAVAVLLLLPLGLAQGKHVD